MINPEQKLTGGAAKVEEYVGRIQSGESSEEIMKGLPDSFRTAIEAKLNPEKDKEEESEEAVLLAQEARQETKRMAQEDEINSANRANEIRTELGLPVQPVEQSLIEATDAEILSPEEQKARDIKAGFNFMAEAFKGAGKEKIREYDERLRAAMAGKPIKAGDTVDNLMPDFKRFAKVDWTPDINLEKLSTENEKQTESHNTNNQELSPEEKAKLVEDIKQKYNDIGLKKRMRLRDEMFMVSQGINPENDEMFQTVDGEIGINYDAHGVAKSQQLDQLLNLLDHGISKDHDFYTAPFEVPADVKAGLASALGTSGGTAYKDGLAVLTSGYKEKIQDSGVKHVFINDVFSGLKRPLQEAYPQYQFHLLSEQKAVLEGEASKADKQQ